MNEEMDRNGPSVNRMHSPDPPCNCGSGEKSWWEYTELADGKLIAICRVCSQCIHKKLSNYQVDTSF